MSTTGGHCGIANSEATDSRGRRQIAFEQHWRNRENARDVVETLLIRVVGRQQRSTVDLEPEQVTNGVRVFDPVQSMHRDPSRIRFGRGGVVEGRLDSSTPWHCRCADPAEACPAGGIS